MAKELSQATTRQINNKRIDKSFIFKINGTDRSNYVIDYNFSNDKAFGSATASITLDNVGGIFGDSGAWKINIGDIIELIESFDSVSETWPKFYGKVDQRNISKTSKERNIVINCLDHISNLQYTDIDLDVEADKISIEEETLDPQFLASPNDNLAQVFNFSNSGIAQDPPPLITIRPQDNTTLIGEEPQYDGFEIRYAEGQLKLGTPLNVENNYDVVCTKYYFYPRGIYAEDILEEILKTPDGYGKYLYGETSAEDVVTNHLTETFQNTEGSGVNDSLIPNLVSSDIIIYQKLTEDYDPESSLTDVTVLVLESTDGLPTSGTATVSGESFSWTGKTSTTLTGIATPLKFHPENSYVKYENTYEAGQVWYHKFSNITSVLSTGSYDLPSGTTIDYIDYRFGRIILDAPISTNSTVEYIADYTFKTLGATGVLLNRMRFNPREVANKFEAIKNVLEFIAPNYVMRTEGTDKIWSSYMAQNVNPDYTLNLVERLNYLEDIDLYTRVKLFGKNINPSNIVLNDGVQFVSTDQEFKATASQSELLYEKEEGNFYVYKTTITDAGRIDINVIKPVVYINNVPINDKPQIISLMPVVITATQRVETEVQEKRSGSPDVTVRQYFYYKIRFAHTSIDPTQTINIYNAVGQEIITLAPGASGMDYANGIYNVPGNSQNATVEQASTASYTVFYSTAGIEIDVNTVRFKISKQLLPGDHRSLSVVAATFQYWTALTPFDDVGSVIDGRFETQVQTEFFAEPPTGLPYAILDLGQIYNIQAIDFVAGFYKPDNVRKFDVNFRFSLQYSYDNIDFFSISPDTQNIDMSGGSSKSFEEDQLGADFSARYLRINLEDVKKIDYGDNGVWVVAFSEVAVYTDIVLSAEATLIPTTYLAEDLDLSLLDSSGVYPTTITVDDASEFEIPDSGETATAYIGTDGFTYTGIESNNTFVGVEGLSDDHDIGDRVSQELESDNTLYDYDLLLPKLGDRLYKELKVRDDILYTQERLNILSKAFLNEFVKDHTKIQVDVLFAPYLKIGQTVSLTDSYQGISNVNYFIESIRGNSTGKYQIVLARYPS